jgi:hypothetical protein
MAIEQWQDNPDGHWEIVGEIKWYLHAKSKVMTTTTITNVVSVARLGRVTSRRLDTRNVRSNV